MRLEKSLGQLTWDFLLIQHLDWVGPLDNRPIYIAGDM